MKRNGERNITSPGFRSRLVSLVLQLVPKTGPFKSLAFWDPTPEVEKLFMASFNASVDNYRTLLVNVDASHFQSQNENLDVGRPTLASEYLGADLAYDKLLSKLADHKFVGVSAELRNNILDYYQGRTSPASRLTEKARAESAKLMEQREQLDHLQPETAATP